ncbi:PGF-CTERM-anchored ABC transporter substrate-binding protein [Haladaptatus sp. GCM10025707]|uniref:PGF-CTERM-anchored ABC transporter substrate-binding protein n=1 Tax=unclassified Haladaptatus TaxID=2622732 RepID=UPI0023E7BD98|nr:PGF-CTERM-anchored ABC transporter substrate-binding protein [Haladaptatus sp. QDMS2]
MNGQTHAPIVIALLVAVTLLPVGAVGHATGSNAISAEECSFPVTLTDATGTEVRLTEEPTRVVTLSPSAAQTMWEIGEREKVVGLTKYASNLEGAETRTNVSSGERIVNIELVVGLEPDLVLAPNATSKDTIRALRAANVTVYHIHRAETIEDIEEKVTTVGRLVGSCDGAGNTVASMRQNLSVVDTAVEGEDRPTVLYSFYGYTAGSDTFIDTIIERAGGRNVAAEAGIEGYQAVNPEFIVGANPDWIIRNTDTPAVPKTDAYNETTAVKSGNVVVIQLEYLNRPAPRTVRAVSKLAATLHPEAYAATSANASTESTATATTTRTTATNSTTVAESTTQTTGPGFSLLVTFAAFCVLSAVALFGRSER